MKKTLLLLLFIVCIKQTNAQEQWSINIYFEDATGATDMLTFGYDPTAGEYLDEIDPQFGENWQQIDTTKFNVYILKNTPPYYSPITPPIDTNIVLKKSPNKRNIPRSCMLNSIKVFANYKPFINPVLNSFISIFRSSIPDFK